MFKRFHEKQTQSKDTSSSLNATYAQIRKDQISKKSNYAKRHQNNQRIKGEVSDDLAPLMMECHKTDEYLFQGVVKGNVKCGEGAMMLKNGTFIFGQWSNGLLNGKSVVFTPFGGRVLANLHNGKLNGWALTFYGSHIVRCTLYYENQIDGQKMTYDDRKKMWVASKCSSDGRILSIVHAERGIKGEPPSFAHSEELRDMIKCYIVNGENFLDTQILEQFSIGCQTNYIGFADEERKPCGLGCAYSKKEMYMGNFFEGVLEHYGRMVFQNGDIYQGELLGGTFRGRGLYYSPLKNQTSILLTNQTVQCVEREFPGYAMIDIIPSIGVMRDQGKIGLKGDALKRDLESLQPYYLKEFGDYKKKNTKSKSIASEYGHSEEMNSGVKDGKEVSAKDEKSIDKEELPPHFAVKDGKPAEKWLNFQTMDLNDLRRTQSLDKREVIVARKKHNNQVKMNTNHEELQSTPMKQNLPTSEMEWIQRSSPKAAKLMQEIPFGKPFNIKAQTIKVVETESVNMRKLSQLSGEKGRRENEGGQRMQEMDKSEHSSYLQGDSKKLATIFEKGRNNRKKIFF